MFPESPSIEVNPCSLFKCLINCKLDSKWSLVHSLRTRFRGCSLSLVIQVSVFISRGSQSPHLTSTSTPTSVVPEDDGPLPESKRGYVLLLGGFLRNTSSALERDREQKFVGDGILPEGFG